MVTNQPNTPKYEKVFRKMYSILIVKRVENVLTKSDKVYFVWRDENPKLDENNWTAYVGFFLKKKWKHVKCTLLTITGVPRSLNVS